MITNPLGLICSCMPCTRIISFCYNMIIAMASNLVAVASSLMARASILISRAHIIYIYEWACHLSFSPFWCQDLTVAVRWANFHPPPQTMHSSCTLESAGNRTTTQISRPLTNKRRRPFTHHDIFTYRMHYTALSTPPLPLHSMTPHTSTPDQGTHWASSSGPSLKHSTKMAPTTPKREAPPAPRFVEARKSSKLQSSGHITKPSASHVGAMDFVLTCLD